MFKFRIKSNSEKAKKEGNEIVRFSGDSEPFRRVDERQSFKVGVDVKGNPKVVYVTGLNKEKVDLYRWLTDDEKKILSDQLDEFTPIIEKAYGGKDVIDETNSFFWGKDNRNINKVFVTDQTEQSLFEVSKDKPANALLYFSIMAGAFVELIAPNKEWAQRNQTYHYLILEAEDNLSSDDTEIVKMESMMALGELKAKSPEELLFLVWALLPDTTGFGGMTKATPQREMLITLNKYIDGKLTLKKGKKDLAKNFLTYIEKMKKPLTKQAVYAEAYLKAGEYFALINRRDKKYVTSEGTVLGSTASEAVDNLLKDKFSKDLESLRDGVEKKWSE